MEIMTALSAIAILGIATAIGTATWLTVARDGYRQVPTRTFYDTRRPH